MDPPESNAWKEVAISRTEKRLDTFKHTYTYVILCHTLINMFHSFNNEWSRAAYVSKTHMVSGIDPR